LIRGPEKSGGWNLWWGGDVVKKYSKRLKTLADIRRFLASAINDLDAGKLEESKARCPTYMCSILSQVIRDSDLEQRLETLEKQAAERGIS
jgi:hypothetical protein